MNNNIHFSSKTDDWSTPQWLFDEYNKIFNFELDVCASVTNAKCSKYYTKEYNGLIESWTIGGNVWCNPPYGRQIKDWVKKAHQESVRGVTTVMLLPARTDTSWWHDYCIKGHIRFLRGRLKFGDSKNSAPFPSAIVIFYGNSK